MHGVNMAVLVKPNGLLGNAYLAAIKPFWHLIVYPAMLRTLERPWRAHPASGADALLAEAGRRG